MSHTIVAQSQPFGFPTFVQLSIQDYTQGGEVISITNDLQGKACKDFVFFPTLTNSLGVLLFGLWAPVNIFSGKIRLFQITGGVASEIPTTAALNCNLSGLAQLT